MTIIKKVIRALKRIQFKYLASKSLVKIDDKSKVFISKDVKIYNCRISVTHGSSLKIGHGCILRNIDLQINGDVSIGNFNIFDNGSSSRLKIHINNGKFILGEYNRIKSVIMIRFGGILTIGDRNNVNDETEIRVDQEVSIGNYNQISYRCIIWDTNTHNIYTDLKRRELTDEHYPIFGYEFEKPKTKPVSIGNDCWIGRGASILKGVKVQNSSIIGYNTTLSNCVIEERKVVVSKIENVVLDR